MSAPLFLLVDHILSLCCSLVNADPLTAAVKSGKFSAHASSADRALSYSLHATFLVIIGLLDQWCDACDSVESGVKCSHEGRLKN